MKAFPNRWLLHVILCSDFFIMSSFKLRLQLPRSFQLPKMLMGYKVGAVYK